MPLSGLSGVGHLAGPVTRFRAFSSIAGMRRKPIIRNVEGLSQWFSDCAGCLSVTVPGDGEPRMAVPESPW